MSRASTIISEALTSYQTDGTVYRPAMDSVSTLESATYAVRSDMRGIFFVKKNLEQDAIIRFRDPRLKAILAEADKFWDIRSDFKDLGFVHKRGILLAGAPGVGKSVLLAQVSEDAIKKNAIVLYAGDPREVTQALSEFREVEPERDVVVIFDDMDKYLYNEGGFVSLLDGENKIEHVLFLGTTNYPERFPPRLLRAGRFDTKVLVETPPAEGRLEFFKSKLKTASEAELSNLVTQTAGMTFAQLREVLVSVYAYKRNLDTEVARINNTGVVQVSASSSPSPLSAQSVVAS